MTPEIDALKVPILHEDHESSPSTLTTPKSKFKKWIIIPSVISGAGLFGLLLNFIVPYSQLLSGSFYSVIIDAGSSGSRVHVFGYDIDQSGKPVFNFEPNYYATSTNTKGLSQYRNNMGKVSEKVDELVKFAKKKVPNGMWQQTDIRLMATAGMRSLQNEVVENAIIDATKDVLRSSVFKFKDDWASIISGSDEGLYAWVIANHALGSLGNDQTTTGIVELGGASAQVTFVSPSDSLVVQEDWRNDISYGNVEYKIYSHSFDGYGKDAALERILDKLKNEATEDEKVQDPCSPVGYTYKKVKQTYSSVFLADESKYANHLEGAGDFTGCKAKTLELLEEGQAECESENTCFIGSTYTPKLQNMFLATSNFVYTGKFFNLSNADWLLQLEEEGNTFCQKTWAELKIDYPRLKDDYLRGYCFSSAYIIAILEKLGINDSTRIEYTGNKNDISLDWALGAFIDSVLRPTAPAPAPAPAPASLPPPTSTTPTRKIFGF